MPKELKKYLYQEEEEKMEEKLKVKLMLKTTDDFWKRVLKYKIDHEFPNNNKTVLNLIEKGLKK